MKRLMKGLLAMAALVAVGAQADTRETQQKNLDKYTPYLQAPVDNFTFWSLYKYQLVGPQKIVVWSTIRNAYLITVEKECPGLEWAHGIGLTSQELHHVTKRFDFVTLANDRCRIVEIQPVDIARMQKDQHGKVAPPPAQSESGAT